VRKGSHKYEYDRDDFGWRVREHRESLGLSYRGLAQRVLDQTSLRINAATILHAELGDRSLPEAQREALEAALDAYGEVPDLHRSEPASPPSALPGDDPTDLEAASHWSLARDRWSVLAHEAAARKNWTDWAGYTSHSAMMEMQLGNFETSAALFNRILRQDPHAIGMANLSDALQNRGWLDMARHDYASAAAHLRTSGVLLQRLGKSRTRTYHFLGRTFCAWGVDTDNPGFRAYGQRVLMRAYTLDLETQNFPSLGYDLLQQIPSMSLDDPSKARRYLAQSQELLGREAFVVGHYHLKLGLLRQYSDPGGARACWEQASRAYAQGMFYNNGVSEALRLLSRSLQEDRDTLPQAASYALVAAIALPFVESLELLEEVSLRVFNVCCDSVVRRHAEFWEEQLANIYQMGTPPFDLLRTLTARPDGAAYIQRALERAQAAIRDGLPEYLTRREQETLAHCLLIAHVR
jgi:tetratricopeptide (TPR) repeat protein